MTRVNRRLRLVRGGVFVFMLVLVAIQIGTPLLAYGLSALRIRRSPGVGAS